VRSLIQAPGQSAEGRGADRSQSMVAAFSAPGPKGGEGDAYACEVVRLRTERKGGTIYEEEEEKEQKQVD